MYMYYPHQNIPLPSRIYLHFKTCICDPPRIHPSLPKYTHLFNNYMRPSQNVPLPPSQNIPAYKTTICDLPRIYPSLPEMPPPLSETICDPSRIYPPFQQLYATLPESTPTFQNIPPSTIYDVVPTLNTIDSKSCVCWEQRIILLLV